MWVTLPKDFGRVAKDLSPDGTDQSKKSLYVIRFDDQQRDWNVPPRYYGVFWSAGGPAPVNQVAISLWSQFCNDPRKEDMDSEENIDGEDTEPGECYSGFACFGYGSIAISLDVEQVGVGEGNIDRLYRSGMLKKALQLVGVSSEELDGLMIQVHDPSKRDKDCIQRINTMFGAGGAVPKDT